MSATDEFARRLRAAANEIDHTTTGIDGDAQVIRLGELAQTVRKIANEIDHLGVAPTSAADARGVKYTYQAALLSRGVMAGQEPDRGLSLIAHILDLVRDETITRADVHAMFDYLTHRFGSPAR